MRITTLIIAIVATSLASCSVEGSFVQAVLDANHDVGSGSDAAVETPVELVVSSTTMTVTEGSTQQFTVRLSAQPASSVLVTVETSDDTRLAASPTALLFSPTDWATDQTVTLTGRPDNDPNDENVTVTLRSTAIATPMTISVTVDDDDGLALAITPSTLDVGEGASATVNLRLTAMPPANVTVAIASLNTAVATVSTSMVTFTPANYAIDQAITVSGVEDADIVTSVTTIEFTSADLTTTSLPVQVADNDVLGITTSASSLSLVEGASGTFTVALSQQPPGNVSVTVTSGNGAVATVGPSPLQFTPATWNTPQTVTVISVADDDVANGSTSISLMATGLTTRTVAVNVTDDDVQALLTTPASTVAVTEGGTTTVGVRLAYRPATDVTITAATGNAAVATASGGLTFTPANYATTQFFTITGTQDADTANNTTSLTLEAATLALVSTLTINVTDNDALLTVSTAGSGTGTVASSPAGISNCGAASGADCTELYDIGTSVTLTPTAGASSTFSGWTGTHAGSCTGTAPSCTLSMAASRSVTANFTLKQYAVTVTKAGSGSGTVASSPAGISNCGAASNADCTEPFDHGTSVTLTPTAATGSTFAGWSGTDAAACTGTAPVCTLSVTQARSVTATFTINTYVLTVTKAGAGTGTIASSPAGISNCGAASGADCTEPYNHGTSVTLTPIAAAGSSFAGWSGTDAGACTGTAPACTLAITQARNVTATFTINTYPVTVTKAGTGSGTVASNPAGIIDCGAPTGSDCTENYAHGTSVTLTPTPFTGSSFAGWSGTSAAACTGTAPACTLSVTQARSVTATFTLNSYAVTVTKAGNGSGTVASSPAGITNCGGASNPDCTENFAHGTSVTLTPSPATGSLFTGWSGTDAAACTGMAPVCTLLVTQARTVTATFTLNQYNLRVIRDGAGNGGVTSSPAGITCSGANPDCNEMYNYNTSVTLTAAPSGGSYFGGWSGPCSGTQATCTVTMTQMYTVGASFHPSPVCGDGICNGTESCNNCPLDCGSCNPNPNCGDGFCTPEENKPFSFECCQLDCAVICAVIQE